VIEHREGEVYVHYSGADNRLDEWVPARDVRPVKRRRTSARVAARASADGDRKSGSPPLPPPPPLPPAHKSLPKPRKVAPRQERQPESKPVPKPEFEPEPSSDSDIEIVYIGPKPGEASAPQSTATNGVSKAEEDATQDALYAPLSAVAIPTPQAEVEADGEADVKFPEEEFDIQHHKQITAHRNFDKVNFGQWQIKTWCARSCMFTFHPLRHGQRYFSPYPLSESEPDSAPPDSEARIPGVTRATARSHGRTSDLLAGGLGRDHAEKGILWVCDRCFKYMAEGTVWEAHMVSVIRPHKASGISPTLQRKCSRKNPPGKKVYQRGAHTVWEVDGAKEKVCSAVFARWQTFKECSSIVRTSLCSASYSLTSRHSSSIAMAVRGSVYPPALNEHTHT
jgi:hypothetical protein